MRRFLTLLLLLATMALFVVPVVVWFALSITSLRAAVANVCITIAVVVAAAGAFSVSARQGSSTRITIR